MNAATWEAKISNVLVGRTITAVRYMTDDEVDEMGWNYKGLISMLDDDTEFIALADDEGNDAGAYMTNNADLPVIPVLR